MGERPDYLKKEQALLKSIGAKVHKNSGRGKYQKGDGSNDDFVIDAKFANKTFTISRDVWGKICTDALRQDSSKSPMLLLIVGEPPIRLAVVEYDVLEDLMKKAGNDIMDED